MKRSAGICLALVAGLFSTLARAQDAAGIWQSQPGEEGTSIQVELLPCSDSAMLCGKIVNTVGTPPEDPDYLIGKVMIDRMASDGPGKWSGGTIWAPDEDETYDAELELKDANTLSVSGCILGGLICRGQDWFRVP
ncbi:MAG: DUF2147 domain-containing protein [Pseudomonadota bacterium]